MRKDLIETEQIEKYILHQLTGEEQLYFEKSMIIDPAFAENVEAQKHVYSLTRIFSRKQQRNKLEYIYRQLLQETSFAQSLKNIFH